MSNNTRLAELMNYINVNTTSGTKLEVSGSIKQTAVVSAMLKTDSSGNIIAATAGTDFLTSVGISNLTATGTPSSSTYLRGDNTWATISTSTGLLPTGGTTGQLLSKIDGADYNTQWIDNYATQLKHEVKLGAALAKGKAVYVSTADGTNMIVSAASNASESTSSKTLGLLETGGALNDIVKVVTEGLLAGLNTSTATIGDPVWLGTSGDLLYGLSNKPVAPAHLVFIGIVTRVNTNNGEIFVKPQNGFEIEELHNVLFTSKTDKDLMYWDNATSLWKNAQLSTVLGYTPYSSANPSNYISLTALSSTATGLTYSNTTGVFSLTSGYIIPTTTSATNWDTAYTNRITSLTTTGSSGSASLTTNTLNIPTYTLSGLGGVPTTRTLTINGTAYDLSADRSWTITSMIYPAAGIAVSTGTAWGTSITDNSANWNTAYTNRITSLTTTGSSGAATLTSNTLNIPNYTLAGLGGQASSTNLTSLSGLTYASTAFVKMTAAGTFSLDTSVYGTGTVTSVGGTGTVSGLTLSGTVTTSGNLTLGGTLSVAASNFSSQTANTFLAAPNGAAGTPTFRAIVAADIPTLNQNTTGTSSNITAYTINQSLGTANTPTFADVYSNGWFRNNTSGQGLYNQAVSNHFYASNSNDWNIAATGAYPKLWLRDGYAGTSKLALYTDSTASGLLNSASYWGLRFPYGSGYAGGAEIYGPVAFKGQDNNVAGMKMVSHSVNKVGSSKFLKIYAGVNNYFTGFIFGFNFDNYPPSSATSTGAGFSYQFGGYSDGSGVHAEKYFDLQWFGGNNVGNLGREMNTDGNGFIITSPTSTGAGGYKVSATIMIFARDASQLTFTYY